MVSITKSIIALLVVAVVASILFVAIIIPLENTTVAVASQLSGASSIKTTSANSCSPSPAVTTCSAPGALPAPVTCLNTACGRGRGAASPSIAEGTCAPKFSSAPNTCSEQWSWDLRSAYQAPPSMPLAMLAFDACAPPFNFQLDAVGSSKLSLTGGRMLLRLDNAGSCDAKIVSVVLQLEHVGSHQIWATSAMENNYARSSCRPGEPATLTPICIDRCRLDVEFSPSHVMRTGLPNSDLSTISVPSGTKNNCDSNDAGTGVELDLTYTFDVPADMFAATAYDPTFHVNTFVTSDACCASGNAPTRCSIDYDCDTVPNTVETRSVKTPPFKLSTSNPEVCTQRCAQPPTILQLVQMSSGANTLSQTVDVFTSSSALVNGNTPQLSCCSAVRLAVESSTPITVVTSVGLAFELQPQYPNGGTIPSECRDAMTGASTLDFPVSASASFTCPTKIDCVLSNWSPWVITERCIPEGASSTRYRFRFIATPASNGGAPCPGPMSETDITIIAWEQWTAWSSCDATGFQSRSRAMLQAPYNQICQPQTATQACNGCVQLPTNAAWVPDQVDTCAVSFNNSLATYARTVSLSGYTGGVACTEAVEQGNFTLQLAPWTEWTAKPNNAWGVEERCTQSQQFLAFNGSPCTICETRTATCSTSADPDTHPRVVALFQQQTFTLTNMVINELDGLNILPPLNNSSDLASHPTIFSSSATLGMTMEVIATPNSADLSALVNFSPFLLPDCPSIKFSVVIYHSADCSGVADVHDRVIPPIDGFNGFSILLAKTYNDGDLFGVQCNKEFSISASVTCANIQTQDFGPVQAIFSLSVPGAASPTLTPRLEVCNHMKVHCCV